MKIYWTNCKFINVQKSQIIAKGLTIFFLLILLSENSFSQNHYSYLSNKELCEEATYIDGSRWKNYVDNNEVINEALLRNLSISSCKVLTNRSNKITKEKSIEIKNKIGQPVFCKYHKDIYYIKQSKNKKVIDDSDSFWNQSLYRGLSNGCGINSKQISLSEFCKSHSTQILNFCSDEAIDDVKVVKLPKKKLVKERVSISPEIDIDEQDLPVVLIGNSDYPSHGPTHRPLNAQKLVSIFKNIHGYFPRSQFETEKAMLDSYIMKKPAIICIYKDGLPFI